MRVLIKREDLNHPTVSGNKWWKLKHNLEAALAQGSNTLLTFGGAFSNHIYATAAAASELGLNSIGIIRGEETLPLNKTLSFAKSKGMMLEYVSREKYREKENANFIDELRWRYGDFYLIPEGGTNEHAVNGVMEFAQGLSPDFNYLCCAVGTGGTMTGLIRGLEGKREIVGVAVLKGDFLNEEIRKFLPHDYGNWSVLASYHHGGYAKTSDALLSFIKEMKATHNLELDHVYTGKLLWGIVEEIKRGFFERGSTVLILHSGGLQG